MIDKSEFLQLLDQLSQPRKSLETKTNALRLVNGELAELPGLTIDKYNNHYVIQLFQKLVKDKLELVCNSLIQEFDPDYLIIKDRTSSNGRSLDNPSVDIRIKRLDSITVVTENRLKFEVNMNDTINTGLFLDMRDNRELVGQLSHDIEVLNCFAYTCSFGVYARANRAKRVVNVDISSKNLEKGQRNYSLNKIEPARNEFIRSDCRLYLEKAVLKNNRFDLIIIDPPTFARADGKVFQVQKEFPKLINLSLQILNKQGKLFLSSNCSEIDTLWFKQAVSKEAKSLGKYVSKFLNLGASLDFQGKKFSRESHLAAILAELE